MLLKSGPEPSYICRKLTRILGPVVIQVAPIANEMEKTLALDVLYNILEAGIFNEE